MSAGGATRPGAGPPGSVLSAAVVYWAVVFAAGFVLGAIRVTTIVPRLGETAAVVLELPVMLTISWSVAWWLCMRFAVPARARPRLIIGAVALVLLIAAEAGLAVFAFGETLASWAASLGDAPGFLGLLGQIAFAMIPLVQATASRAS